MDAAARVVVLATALIGVLVGWASAIPITVRSAVLLLALLGWTIAVAAGTGQLARAAWLRSMTWTAGWATALGAAGIGVAILNAAQLQLVRSLSGRPALVWNVDWEYEWNHAQAIARFGGVDHALDYTGVPLDYHVGPAWLGAAVHRILGTGMTEVLFGLVPVLCVLSAAIALLWLLGGSGVPRRLAAAAVGVVFCLPAGFKLYHFPRVAPQMLFNADMWIFSPGLMLNSFLGIAVGLCSVTLLLDRRISVVGSLVGVAGLGSLVQIKPQFFAGLGLVLGVVAVGRLLSSASWPAPSWTLFLASGGVLALALIAKSVLPGTPMSFSTAVWAPGETGYSFRMDRMEVLIVPLLLAALAWPTPSTSAALPRHRFGQPRELVVALVTGLVLLSTVLIVVSFQLRPDMVARAKAIGVDYDVAKFTQRDLAQALVPLRLLLAVSACTSLAVVFFRSRRRALVVVILAGLVVASPLPLVARNFAEPLRGYEAVEDHGLLRLLRQVPREGELLIASDLADPAQNYQRSLRGFLLTAYGGHLFYVANLAYVHYDRADAVHRLADLRTFFGSQWSSWHGAWLRRTQITHVLVSDRCRPRWWGQPDVALNIVARSGRWTLLEAEGLTGGADAVPPPWDFMTPEYGRSSCL